MSYARCRNDVAACAPVSACMSSLPVLVLCRGEDGGTASLCLTVASLDARVSRLAPAPPLTQACSQYASLLPCAALGPHPSHRRHHRPDPRQLTDPQLHSYTFPSLHSIQTQTQHTTNTKKRTPRVLVITFLDPSIPTDHETTAEYPSVIGHLSSINIRLSLPFQTPAWPLPDTLPQRPIPPHARPYACAPSIRTLGLACTTSNPATRPPLEQATR